MIAKDSYLIPAWPKVEGVHTLVTTRFGGVSEGPFTSFNQALHCGDKPTTVLKNRLKLMQDQNISQIQWLHQVHGTRVYQARRLASRDPVEADAVWTDQPGLGCAVLTADCLSVFLYSVDAGAVAVAHCGWKGLTGGLLETFVETLPGSIEHLLGWFGPSIGSAVYEVGSDVRHAFLLRYGAENAARVFRDAGKAGTDKWYADLPGMARQILGGIGVVVAPSESLCTWEDPRFYSYRRDGGVTGRMASLIWLE